MIGHLINILVDYRKLLRNYLKGSMKVKTCNSPKSTKSDKRISDFDDYRPRHKPNNKNENEDYLSPMKIKLAKSMPKHAKKVLPSKNDLESDNKRTKRKQVKLVTGQLNSTIIIKNHHDGGFSKAKSKNLTVTSRNTSRGQQNAHKRGVIKNEWFNALMLKTTVTTEMQKKRKKQEVKLNLPNIPINQEFLFIGDSFYLVNNFNPTKRILNSFRQACKIEQPNIKFVAQDRDGVKLKSDIKRNNIFLQARKQIQLNNRNRKAVIIQRWWRSYLFKRNLRNPRINPQQTIQDAVNTQNLSQSVISFKSSKEDDDQKRSPFELNQLDDSRGKDQGQESIIFSSFNSTEQLNETKPKKIEFTKQDISKLIIDSYKLPSEENVQENQAIFRSYSNSYAKFKLQEIHISDDSDDSQQISSPKKDKTEQILQKESKPINEVPFDLLQQFQEATRLKEMIEFRSAFQKGHIKPLDTFNLKVGISTSIMSIHSFLVNFFNFYIQNYREEFISLINMPYGYSIPARLRCLQQYGLPEEVEEDQQGIMFGLMDIIDDSKLQEYYQCEQKKSGKINNNFGKANLQLQKIHNKALLDLFNEELNTYRPYHQINGVPYPWNYSYKALTFYFVTDDNIAQVFEKVELKILKNSSNLCGIMLPGQQKKSSDQFQINSFMQDYQSTHPLVLEYNQERELKCIHDDIQKQLFQFDNQAVTGIMVEIALSIFDQLINQQVTQIHLFKKVDNFY